MKRIRVQALDHIVLNVPDIDRSLAFLRREQHWVRAGALCLVASFVLMTFDTFCKN